MCLLVLIFRTSAAAPVMLAANREEFYDRPFEAPAIHAGSTRLMCGTDRRAGGTWLGVNQHGLLVAVTNRPPTEVTTIASAAAKAAEPRSRGLLCREALERSSSTAAAHWVLGEVESGHYGGVNCLCVDRHEALVVTGGEKPKKVSLAPGMHLLTNGELDDSSDMRQQYARTLWAPVFPNGPAQFIEYAPEIMSQGLDASGERTILVDAGNRGTVCSSLITLTADPSAATWLFAPGRPDQNPYQDFSPQLRELLTGK